MRASITRVVTAVALVGFATALAPRAAGQQPPAAAPAAAPAPPATAPASPATSPVPPTAAPSEPAAAPSGPVLAPAPTANDPNAIPSDYTVRLRELEQRVSSLKEKIHESKARLIQLQEVVLHGTIAGAKARIVHRNELGSSFSVERVQYALDASPIFNKVDQDGELDTSDEITIFDGSIVPGNHQLSVYIVLRGNGFGIFSYLNNYRFKLKSSYTFTAEEGKETTVSVVAFEKGDITVDLAERPSLRYDLERKRALRAESGAAPAAGTPAAPAPPTATP